MNILQELILGIVLGVGSASVINSFFKQWKKVENEAKDNKKMIEYYGLIMATLALVISAVGVAYTVYKVDSLEQKLNQIKMDTFK